MIKSSRKYIPPEATIVNLEFNNIILVGSPNDGANEDVGYEDWSIGPSEVMGSPFDSLF